MKLLSLRLLVLVLAGVGCQGLLVAAQPVQHLSTLQPGGMPGLPVMQGIDRLTNGVQISWDGPSGYYQIFQKSNSLTAPWVAWGKATNLLRTATLPLVCSNAFFRVSGPAPVYAGSKICISCHLNVCRYETNTAHASAFSNTNFIAAGGQTNASCLVCHTVGYGLTVSGKPVGFVSAATTPQFEGVQCENCHGPAANHAANEDDPSVRPQVEIAATLCGGCHHADNIRPKPPTFEEWSASGHGAVVPDVLQQMASSTTSISSCGRCHSGSVRLALLAGENPSVTLANDFNVAITCAVCHDPHAQSVWTNRLNGVIAFTNVLTGNPVLITNNALGQCYTNQLRCALASTNDFVLTSSDVFSNTYNPNINICAQCHNDRGDAWTNTVYAPHHSPQYNMLLGTVGELATGPTPGLPSTHSRLEMQCVECHMQTTNDSSNHSFGSVTYQLCSNCHSDPAGLIQFVTNSVASQIQLTKSYLDLWAAVAAPAGLQKYGAFAWEYTHPGDLSPGGAGPVADDQALIPDAIKKARFDLYLVSHDGSYGVHNAPYDVELLQTAQTWIFEQLYQ